MYDYEKENNCFDFVVIYDDRMLEYGQYKYSKVVYLAPISSNTEDYLDEELQNVEVHITESVFKIGENDLIPGHILIEKPKYQKETVDDYRSVIKNIISCYVIIDEYNSEQNQKIILTKDANEIIIMSFYNNGDVADAISFYKETE